MIIYSDINIEPFVKLENKELYCFHYKEDYLFPENIENETILFVFSDFFRLYSKRNFEIIFKLIENAAIKNRVILIGDMFFGKYRLSNNITIINSGINDDDYNLELGYYSQFPFNKSGKNKLQNLISTTAHKLQKPIIKSIFVDLDHTLIPGVWEEDKDFIKQNYLSHKMWRFRRLLKILIKCNSHGSQIIIVSKNDYNSIEEALDFIYPQWKTLFTHIDYGWNQKGERIKENIKKMNIGPQDCIFIDDNKIEIHNVVKIIPDITGIHFDGPHKLNLIEKICLHSIDFNKTIDNDRNKFYSDLLGSGIDSNIGVSNTSYTSEILKNEKNDFERIKELSVKTNQMNFIKSEIINIDTTNFEYYSLKCTTEFSNLGMIGYYIFDKKNMVIENFVMSCRALGFGLEIVFLESALKLTNKFKFIESAKNNVAQILIKQYTKNGRIIIQST